MYARNRTPLMIAKNHLKITPVKSLIIFGYHPGVSVKFPEARKYFPSEEEDRRFTKPADGVVTHCDATPTAPRRRAPPRQSGARRRGSPCEQTQHTTPFLAVCGASLLRETLRTVSFSPYQLPFLSGPLQRFFQTSFLPFLTAIASNSGSSFQSKSFPSLFIFIATKPG